LNIEEHRKIRKLQKNRLKVRTDDLFTFRTNLRFTYFTYVLTFASDDVIPGKHNQTAY